MEMEMKRLCLKPKIDSGIPTGMSTGLPVKALGQTDTVYEHEQINSGRQCRQPQSTRNCLSHLMRNGASQGAVLSPTTYMASILRYPTCSAINTSRQKTTYYSQDSRGN